MDINKLQNGLFAWGMKLIIENAKICTLANQIQERSTWHDGMHDGERW